MRVLTIGASGFIGRYVSRRFADTGAHTVFSTYNSRPPVDDGASWHRLALTDDAELEALFDLARPDAVVHLAAMADVGTAERNPEVAAAVNATATATIARLAERHGAHLVFVSTEYVFDGQAGPYTVDDSPSPNTQYGRTKFEGEQAVAALASNWSIVRTSIVYGWPAPGRRNFVPMLVDRLRNGEPYQAPTNVYRSPVYMEHLVDGIVRIVEGTHTGVQHVAGPDWVSMRDFALAVAHEFGLDANLVNPVSEPTDDRRGLEASGTMAALRLPHPGLPEGLAAMIRSNPCP